MVERTLVFDGTDIVSEFGLVYSSFSEELPKPKTSVATIPYGIDIDFTDTLGPVSYSSGLHVLVFLLCKGTERERIAAKQRIVSMLHGKRAEYSLSWDEGYTYAGRAVVALNHLDELVDVVTVTITRDPFKVTNEAVSPRPSPRAVIGGVHLEYDISSYDQVDVAITHKDALTVYVDGTQSVNYLASTTSKTETLNSVYGNVISLYLTTNSASHWYLSKSKSSLDHYDGMGASAAASTYADNNMSLPAWSLDGHDLVLTETRLVITEGRSL